jgi:hypothetical protein
MTGETLGFGLGDHSLGAAGSALSEVEWRLVVPYPQALASSRRTALAELPTLAMAAASSSWLQPSVVVQ